MKVYWQQENNVGDKLSPYILKKIFNVDCEFSNNKRKMLAIGSILSHATEGDYIWGSGLISPKHLPKSRDLNVLALRGPLTRKYLEDYGVKINKNIPYGDPALLLPRVYFPKKLEKVKEGIVPHYTDLNWAKKSFKDRVLKGEVKIIDPRLPIEEFVDELFSCEMVFSSSLHGLIIADAYNIPNKRVVFGNRLIGGDFKFNDYEQSKKDINLRELIEVFKLRRSEIEWE